MKTPLGLSSAVVLSVIAVLAGDLRGAQSGGNEGLRTASAARLDLTVDSIMRGPKLVGYPPTALRWSGDSSRLYFEWRKGDETEASTWIVNKDGSGLRKLSDSERRSVPTASATWDMARQRALIVDDGDVVVLDRSGSRRALTRTTARESSPRWARNETAVTFVRDNNLFLMSLENGADGLIQLTDVQLRRPEPRESDMQKFLKAEEQQLIEHTRESADERKQREAREKERALPKFDLRDRQSVPDLLLMPDGIHVMLLVLERGEAKRADVPNYVTETSYTESIPARMYVGDYRDKQTLFTLNLQTGVSHPADAGFAGSGRELYWSLPTPTRRGTLAVTAARAANYKDRWIVTIDPATGNTRVLDHQHDDAWIRDLGRSYGWLPDDQRLWFTSERDGWMHLYSVDAAADRSEARQLTNGTWEISEVALSVDRKTFYLTSSESDLGEQQIYSMNADGGARTRLTRAAGSNEGPVSPDGTTVAMVHSYANTPPEVFVLPLSSRGVPRQVTRSASDEWLSFKWIDPRIVKYQTRDGVAVTARLFTPEMIGARRDPRAPAVVFVHGAGYLQDAHRYWSTYYREHMFHNLLAARGYVVLAPDYRASAGYGRDWRTAIYRHMGGKDLDDVVDGAKYLVDREQIDARRIGVYGGSYGGFITLMALFTSPDTFAAGAALRPVTDWSHYNQSYTASILNEPQTDPEAYRRSSPIYFASGLTKPLLIAHGMVDTNVLFQDTVRLVQRLIELGKDFDVAPYPVENHNFDEETSWADEYKRILKLFETHLKGTP